MNFINDAIRILGIISSRKKLSRRVIGSKGISALNQFNSELEILLKFETHIIVFMMGTHKDLIPFFMGASYMFYQFTSL